MPLVLKLMHRSEETLLIVEDDTGPAERRRRRRNDRRRIHRGPVRPGGIGTRHRRGEAAQHARLRVINSTAGRRLRRRRRSRSPARCTTSRRTSRTAVCAFELAQPVGVDTAEELLKTMERDDAELLVIGIRHRNPVGKLLLGSVSQQLAAGMPEAGARGQAEGRLTWHKATNVSTAFRPVRMRPYGRSERVLTFQTPQGNRCGMASREPGGREDLEPQPQYRALGRRRRRCLERRWREDREAQPDLVDIRRARGLLGLVHLVGDGAVHAAGDLPHRPGGEVLPGRAAHPGRRAHAHPVHRRTREVRRA